MRTHVMNETKKSGTGERQGQPFRPKGLLHRFLDWLARGADQAAREGKFCGG
jgi:hypothetical protein